MFSQQALEMQAPSLRQITLKVQAVQGINLGQGVCQLPVPDEVLLAAHEALDDGINRYTSPRGLLSLREALAEKLRRHNQIAYDPEQELLVTVGSTGAFEGVCATLINAGDHVVSFSPYYPYHHNTLRRYNAKVTYVPLEGADLTFDSARLEKALQQGVKFLLVNTPGNPTGKVFTQSELKTISELTNKHNCLVVTDEIYEYMIYDGRVHISPAAVPGLRERTITIGGYSKTFAITGWRIGYLALPSAIAEKMVPMLDSIYVCPPAPLQEAVARAIVRLDDSFYTELASKYQQKRDRFAKALRRVGMVPHLPQGAYYMIASFNERWPNIDSMQFVEQMIARARVGAVPANDFVPNPEKNLWVRFCFAVPDEVLEQAAQQLDRL